MAERGAESVESGAPLWKTEANNSRARMTPSEERGPFISREATEAADLSIPEAFRFCREEISPD